MVLYIIFLNLSIKSQYFYILSYMKRITLTSIFLVAIALLSCSSDDVKSSENFIENFSLPGIDPLEINIINEQSSIHVSTSPSNIEKLSAAKPTVEVSKGASLKEEGANWMDEDFKYIVTAENGEVREYSVKNLSISSSNSFEEWDDTGNYYILSDLSWSSGNSGISMAFGLLGIDSKNPENYPSKKTENGYVGNAVLLETIEGGTVFGRPVPLFSGNFFLGNFNVSKAVSDDELEATEFGRIYFSKPKSVKGYYKYKEGTGKNIGNIDKDSCDIYAIFYKAKDETLTAATNDLETNPNVLAFDRWSDCSETEGEGFKEFSLDFGEYANPDFENYKYKLAVVFAASNNGAKFKGKVGSKLIVDEVVIENYGNN